ncbi:MAG: cell wall-active antibiotics response protein [Ignavibacteriaceae bacterium]|jgi:predicted membrane protein|nr:cell wall-active antibiotics response protein [Ignavibacteriaceae bacterium]MCW8818072.1 cell wall-active antibiotics response protein [Ignavibacteriaceae bacterium]MCW8823038.1 cell wall-active antibiotics response protein [Ignavibacteriaceae bacterium]MCW9094954.1 cell wall-active antibiotics response protein [Ignavibacteriaceae bacterium]MCW9098067.1 cell wall-active antibiotics response protein [Ignavibacteriaceae bacterium]
MTENNRTDKRIVLGLILIFLGGIFLLNTMDILHFRFAHVVFSWPFIMLVIGLIVLINTEKKFLGGILSGIGALFLIPRIFPEVDYNAGIIFPIILIVLGAYIILKRRNIESHTDSFPGTSKINKDKIDDVSIFGGGTKIISSSNFQGGNVTAIFGGSEINLMNCQLADGDNVLDVLCVFGGTTIIVPKEWNVVINVTSILGGFSNKAIRNPSVVIDQSKTLHIKGLAMFGGGEVKTYL